MEKYLVNNEIEWRGLVSGDEGRNLGICIEKPKHFPCMAIIAYAGEGWDEIDYCFPEHFTVGDDIC